MPFGIKTVAEVWAAVVYHGMFVGALQSFCRVLFSELLPLGRENEFFSLYEITDKGSAWVGPFLVAAVTDYTHRVRYGFLLLEAMMLGAIIVLSRLDIATAKQQRSRLQ